MPSWLTVWIWVLAYLGLGLLFAEFFCVVVLRFRAMMESLVGMGRGNCLVLSTIAFV